MATIVKELKGHSGSKVFLMSGTKGLFIRKESNVLRNKERLQTLRGILPVPDILHYEDGVLEMEYIHGQDMINYLQYNSPQPLLEFLSNTLNSIRDTNVVDKDYTSVYNEQLYWLLSNKDLPFSKEELIKALPKSLPKTKHYHGDLTLENIIRRSDGKFFLIDPVTVPYDSWVFDLAKLRQDVDSKWFLRNSKARLDAKLKIIDDYVCKEMSQFISIDSLSILMLLRVLRHCEPGDSNYLYLISNINRLWTNICK